MNWRRGLFRLWIVGSVLFVIAVAFVGYSEIKKEFDETALQHYLEANTELLGSRLIKSTIQEQRRGRQRPGSFAPAYRTGLRCA